MTYEPQMTYQQIADEFGICQTQAMKWVNSAIESAKCEFEKRGVPADWLTEHADDRSYE